MNNIIEKILDHRSIRSFEDKLLSEEQINTIVECAQAASTSSYIQAYSIIGVTDPEKKAKLAELAGPQSYVEKNGHLFVFCADLYRQDMVSEMENTDLSESIESTEKFMVACIDAALAAQNAALAAESMDLGICYIGGIRNNLPEVSAILNIPHRVLPLFALVVGYPKNRSDKKPRLPLSNIYHENGYQEDKQEFIGQLEEYNETISSYYERRTKGERKDTWTEQMAGMLGKKSRLYMKDYVEKQGFKKH
ncbi:MULTISPECIES: oxygen-insensitive NADPH nitroreductase [Peribacillus]|uniref:oxygen-insensitive NADPH nitroreductase n=1 Tax=Peribacillus TaxID=2675229 RepID=UPI00203CC0DB|nr:MULTISPECIES: oxygen-insensitive NADPH nitroreductase [Peribacillus]MCM3676683.1 oxygen-insensitive NADPH nitroreductase [Peribacillus simplex]